MPPLEAAICGNCVIGYTGQGAMQYWRDGLFTEIKSGDLLKFHTEIILQTQNLRRQDFHQYTNGNKLHELKKLVNEYTESKEASSLRHCLEEWRNSLTPRGRQ